MENQGKPFPPKSAKPFPPVSSLSFSFSCLLRPVPLQYYPFDEFQKGFVIVDGFNDVSDAGQLGRPMSAFEIDVKNGLVDGAVVTSGADTET